MSESFDPYNVNFNGHKLDPYRVIEIFKITHPAMQQIVKKVLRQGAKHKNAEEDARDIISSAQRFLDMKDEERKWKDQMALNLGDPHDSQAAMFEIGEVARESYRSDFSQ
jgi:hypothetical protein